MGLFDNIFGKKPVPAAPAAEELAAKEAKRLDNAVWAARDAMNHLVPQVIAKYRAGDMAGYDPANPLAERERINTGIGQEMADFHSSWPAASEQFDVVQAEAVDAILASLPRQAPRASA